MTLQVKPELISFKLCPFVQKSVIALLEKKVDFDITYIDLSNKPDWFLKISPFGKVPVLKVGDSVLFESSVINEYLDEVHEPSIHPKDPLQKAYNRAWIDFASNLMMLTYQISVVKTEEEFNQKRDEIIKNLTQLEEKLGNNKFFNGDDFALIDTSYAPFFMRIVLNEKLKPINILEGFPKIQNWSKNLLEKESVQKSVVNDFEELYFSYLKNIDGFIVR